jgi:purine-binding chemotaxis protein CheW
MIRELITFEVEGQVFGLDIMAIREIRAWTPTTRLPRVPHYVAGVVNLRGTVLPVVDLAARLGWRATEPTPRHAIIVTQLGTQIGGWIVDSVSDIVTVPDEAMQPRRPLRATTPSSPSSMAWPRSRTRWSWCSTSRRWPTAIRWPRRPEIPQHRPPQAFPRSRSRASSPPHRRCPQ